MLRWLMGETVEVERRSLFVADFMATPTSMRFWLFESASTMYQLLTPRHSRYYYKKNNKTLVNFWTAIVFRVENQLTKTKETSRSIRVMLWEESRVSDRQGTEVKREHTSRKSKLNDREWKGYQEAVSKKNEQGRYGHAERVEVSADNSDHE